MHWDVTRVRPLAGYRLYVELLDGTKGIFDVTPYLDKGDLRTLRDVHYFNQVDVVMGAVTWPDEQDIAPETLLSGLVPITAGHRET